MFMPNVRQFEAAQPIDTPSNRTVSAPRAGIRGATLIETAEGWRPAETLRPGDSLATWDGGFRPVLSVQSECLQPFADEHLIRVPAGVLNNCGTVWLRNGQFVLIRSTQAAAVLDAEAVLLPAAALTGYGGIKRVPLPGSVTAITLRFAEDEVIFAASGLCLHCASVAGSAVEPGADCGYLPVLGVDRGRDLMALIGAGALNTADLPRAA
jgi:hypothetical protein